MASPSAGLAQASARGASTARAFGASREEDHADRTAPSSVLLEEVSGSEDDGWESTVNDSEYLEEAGAESCSRDFEIFEQNLQTLKSFDLLLFGGSDSVSDFICRRCQGVGGCDFEQGERNDA